MGYCASYIKILQLDNQLWASVSEFIKEIQLVSFFNDAINS